MSLSLKERGIEMYLSHPIYNCPTRAEAEALHARVQKLHRTHGFAGITVFGWTFYGGMWKKGT